LRTGAARKIKWKTFGFAQVALAMRFKKNSLPDTAFELAFESKVIVFMKKLNVDNLGNRNANYWIDNFGKSSLFHLKKEVNFDYITNTKRDLSINHVEDGKE